MILNVLLCIALILPIQSFTQTNSVLTIPRLTGPIEFDGLSDESDWMDINPLPTIMYQPLYGNDPSENTEIRIAYDDDYLYVSGRLFDSEPDKIQVVSLERDGGAFANDWFGIVLDTFDDNENAHMFFTSPAGNRFDAAVTNDAEGSSPINSNWNSFWSAATTINDDGWFAEIRIPWSSLRFQRSGDDVEMSVIAWRFIARKNEFTIFPNIPPKWDWGFLKPSQAQDIVFSNIESKMPLYCAASDQFGSFDLNK